MQCASISMNMVSAIVLRIFMESSTFHDPVHGVKCLDCNILCLHRCMHYDNLNPYDDWLNYQQ